MASSKFSYLADREEDSTNFTAYRLVAPKYADSSLSGEGARLYGGRWNSPGKPMVYLSGSRALAALETLVHLTTPGSRAIPRTLISVSIPKKLLGGKLWTTEGWNQNPPGPPSTDQGDDWLTSLSTVAVSAPSALIPEETNFLLNPKHHAFSEITVTKTSPFSFDPRI